MAFTNRRKNGRCITEQYNQL